LGIKKLARFVRVGDRITDDRRNPSTGAEYDCFHVEIDDDIQLVHIEVLPDKARRLTTAFLVRALRRFRMSNSLQVIGERAGQPRSGSFVWHSSMECQIVATAPFPAVPTEEVRDLRLVRPINSLQSGDPSRG
jgi:hypothetical protein